jgi:alkylation response protein AidB-like acyl-CoA dehydrogenase
LEKFVNKLTAVNASEEQSRALAEESRETTWKGRSFVRSLFLGKLRVDWIHPLPETEESNEFKRVYAELDRFLENEVDSVKMDLEGQYDPKIFPKFTELGLFGIKIAKKYGGLGLTQAEYCKIAELLGSYDGSLTALVSAHNSIGVPQPVKLFGTKEQKDKYLPRCAKGEISAFALTEPDVGSDPARLSTLVTRTPEGDYILNGQKLWITNGMIAKLMVVMARHEDTGRLSAFIVEMDWEGVSTGHRCRFMGLKALENGIINFKDVRVPKENILLKEGKGLKVALVTLNTGRLSLPSAALGGARKCVMHCREFASSRVQWGAPVGKHEAVTHMIANMATTTFAMEAWVQLANELSMLPGYDIRLEAAAAKEWGSTRGWDMIDDGMQIIGGRGYETESSLTARGDNPRPVERMMRDSRINRIFEGSSEIMHLFMAREMVDQHLKVAGALLEKKATFMDKVMALPRVGLFYAGWYPPLWFGLFTPFKYGKFRSLAKHLRYAERASRRLARGVFHIMVVYQAKLEKKQAVLFRTVDIAMEIAVMVAAVVKAQKLVDTNSPDAESAVGLADVHCANARRLIDSWFKDLWANDDALKTKLGLEVLDGKHAWFEDQTRIPE